MRISSSSLIALLPSPSMFSSTSFPTPLPPLPSLLMPLGAGKSQGDPPMLYCPLLPFYSQGCGEQLSGELVLAGNRGSGRWVPQACTCSWAGREGELTCHLDSCCNWLSPAPRTAQQEQDTSRYAPPPTTGQPRAVAVVGGRSTMGGGCDVQFTMGERGMGFHEEREGGIMTCFRDFKFLTIAPAARSERGVWPWHCTTSGSALKYGFGVQTLPELHSIWVRAFWIAVSYWST